MFRRTTAAAAAALVFAALGTAAPAQPARPQPAAIAVPPLAFTTRTLPNGLKVYALRDPSTATVSVQMWYDVGSKDDPEGRSGFAHLFEHILSRVTRNIRPGELSRIVEDAGGARNASTWLDRTNYFETVPANELEAMLWAHAERMDRSVLDEAVFNAERDIVKEELRQRVLATPYGRLQYLALFEESFESHPYKRPAIGSIEHLNAAKLEDARAFHENYYRPDNATLIVAGNFDPAQLNRWIDQHFAPIRKPAKPILRFDARETPRTAARTRTVYAPNVPLPAVAFSWQAPQANHPDAAALDVLQRVLATGESSRLYRTLVYDKQLASGVEASFDGYEDAGMFYSVVTLARGQTVEAGEAALAAEIARLRDAPISAAELAEAKTEYIAASLASRETAQGRGFILGDALVTAGDPRWPDKLLAAVQRVTPADVQRVARKYLRDDRRVTIRYLDETARPGQQASNDTVPPPVRLGLDLPPASKAPNTPAPDAERQAPPAPSAPRPFAAPVIAERTLPNGVRVVVAKSTDVPVATATLVFGGGASADPADKPGVANLTAAVIDNGTRTLSATELATRSEALGAQIGAGASADGMMLYVGAPTANIEAAGRLMADVARNPAFAAEEVERERKLALDALRVNLRQPGFVANQAAARVLYGAAPYGAPASGTEASLGAITRDDLARYHQTWWRPDNATLIVTGSMTPEAGFAFAERLFGDWRAPAGPAPTPPADVAGRSSGPRVVVVDLPNSGQAAVTVAARAAPRGDPAYYPLLLGNSVLGGSSTARLFQEVRVKRALSYGAYSNIAGRRGEGFLTASSQTKNESAVDVADVMLAELTKLGREPVDDEALGKRKTFLSGAFARQVETTQGLGAFLANLAQQGLPMTEVGQYMNRLQAVTPQQVGSAVTRELPADQASIVIVGDAKLFREALTKRFPNAEVIPFDQFDPGSPTLRRAGAQSAAAAGASAPAAP